MKICLWALIIFFLMLARQSIAQESLLNRRVTLSAHQISLDEALINIAALADFTFSYDARILPHDSLVAVEVRDASVAEVLLLILPDDVTTKVTGNHLVLVRKSPPQTIGKKEKITISGTIFSRKGQSPLTNVLVYEPSGLISVISNENGEYSITISASSNKVILSFNKAAYSDTVVLLSPESQEFNLLLNPIPSLQPLPESLTTDNKIKHMTRIEHVPIVKKIVAQEMIVRTDNLDDHINRPFQISFIPNKSTNLKMSGFVENNFSINVLAGYAYGVNGAEIGGLFNINRHDVQWFQAAGLGNLNGGNTTGVQLGGLFNHNRGNLKGFQAAGIHNLVIDTLYGLQMSGISNVLLGGMKGWQFAGISNYTTRNVEGVQMAGISNITLSNVKNIQVAGIVNSAKDVEGLQAAGIVNYASKNVKGLQVAGIANKGNNVSASQIAGLVNVALDTVSGVQISGLMNYAKYTRSSQISFLNYADSASGVPVGFLSFVRRGGFHTLALSSNEIAYANLSFKTGVKRFYNIFTTGIGNTQGQFTWMYGYGVGWEDEWKKNFFMNMEISTHWVNEARNHQKDLSLLNRFQVNFGYRKPGGIAVSAGPAFNVWLSDWVDSQNGEFLSQLAPYTLSTTTINTTRLQTWIGAQVALHW